VSEINIYYNTLKLLMQTDYSVYMDTFLKLLIVPIHGNVHEIGKETTF